MGSSLAAAPAQERKQSFYRPELDILRFCAFVMVFLCHVMPNPADALAMGISPRLTNKVTQIGGYGVDLFFALSAYLITEILLREKRARGSIDIRSFYIRRILRIWPLYYGFLGFTFAAAPLFIRHEVFPSASKLAFLVFLGNWTFLILPKMHSIAGILWSVSIEEQFYLLWPLALRSIEKLKSFCIGLLVFASGYRVALVLLHASRDTYWQSTFARIEPIALGCLLALVLNGRAPRPNPLVAFAGAAVIIATAGLGSDHGPLALATYPLVALGCVGVLYGILGANLHFKPLVALGRISYGLYVYHQFAMWVARRFAPSNSISHWLLQMGASLLLTILFAGASYLIIELPFLKLKDRFAFVLKSADARPR